MRSVLYVGGWRGGDEKRLQEVEGGREGTKSFTRSGGWMEGDKKLYKRWREAWRGQKALQEVEGSGAGGLGNRILMACYWNIHQLALEFVWHLHIGSIKNI